MSGENGAVETSILADKRAAGAAAPALPPPRRQKKLRRYELIKPIGKGKFAVVYRARRIADDELVALKKIAVDSMDHRAREKCLKEVRLLQSLHHPNIIRYLDSLIEGDELVIVFEWAAAGDLKRQIRKAVERKQGFEERVIWKYFSQICDALAHMHEQRILHRDLKPANVFLTLNGTVKVGDLGLGRMMSEHTFEAHSKVGTPLYMSPEVLRGDGYDWKSDVWSLGCVLYELAMLRSPFKAEGLNLYSLFQKISKADYEPLPDTYSAPLRDLATAMLSVDPAERPDVAYVCDVATRMRKETMSAAAAARAEAQRAAPSEAKGEDRGDDAKTTAAAAPGAFADATSGPQAAPEDARRDDVLEAPRAPPKRDPAVGARVERSRAARGGAGRRAPRDGTRATTTTTRRSSSSASGATSPTFWRRAVPPQARRRRARAGGDDFCEESPQVLATALLRDLVDAGYPAERAAQCKPPGPRAGLRAGVLDCLRWLGDAALSAATLAPPDYGALETLPDEGGDGGEVDDDDIAEDIADAGDADVVGIGIALQQNAQNWRQKNALAAKDDDDDGFEVDSLLTDSVS
ncbi:protein serine/threonine kinase [Aureococcus anophagefferens]|uniref:non-specific serine/threonine protein kinase n=2 Tax=Aureococcus anophagefferens TaxID=44056 RepID=A0ABR1FYE1_AURAN